MATALLLKPMRTIKNNWNMWSRRFEQWLTLSSYSTGDNAAAKNSARNNSRPLGIFRPILIFGQPAKFTVHFQWDGNW